MAKRPRNLPTRPPLPEKKTSGSTYLTLLLIAYLVSITLNASLVGLEEGKRGRRKLLSSSYLVGHPENFLSELQQEDRGSLANLVGKAYIYRQLAVRYIGRFVYPNLAS